MTGKTDANGNKDFEVTGDASGRDIYEVCITQDNDEMLCGEIISATFVDDGPGLTLSPATATRNINTPLEFTATLKLDSGSVGGKKIAFDILTGPHTGQTGDQTTDATGKAKWSFTGIIEGTDKVKACYNDKCDESTIGWQLPAEVYLNPATATCTVGVPHVLRATAKRKMLGKYEPLVGKDVTFTVKSGPNAGTVLPGAKTDTNGDAFSECTGDSTGENTFEACIVDNGDVKVCSTSEAVWRAGTTDGPTARCKDITKNALANCKAPVRPQDVNDGSSDPNDSASDLTLALNDTSPFSLGDTNVQLVVTNKAGKQSSCNARIRVVDNTAPTINCNSPGTASAPFTSETTFRATASDNCPGTVDVDVVGENCYRIVGGTRAYKSPDCTVTLSGPSITISPACKEPDHVEWKVEAKDAAGNVQTKTCALIFQGTRRNLGSPPRHFLRS
jgi:hypothetical protein